ncbi:MAG: hypothetical protein HQK62_12390 [Desulfamplus sp.]|nr:hypothetical protein [Desulfamplus sp.]
MFKKEIKLLIFVLFNAIDFLLVTVKIYSDFHDSGWSHNGHECLIIGSSQQTGIFIILILSVLVMAGSLPVKLYDPIYLLEVTLEKNSLLETEVLMKRVQNQILCRRSKLT